MSETSRPNRRPPLQASSPNILSDQPRHGHRFFDDDGPGELTNQGLRHDNDYTDYRNVRILPTIDEILSIQRPVYMPKKNIGEQHFLGHGIPRLLDTQFRHLRYDSIESIRDICYSAAQKVFLNHDFKMHEDLPYHETLSGNRYHLYNEVRLEEFIAHEKKGMLVRLSYECPMSLQGPLLHKSARLETGMLCALMVMDIVTQEVSIVYFDIHMRQSTMSMQSQDASNGRAAVQLAFHDKADHEDILRITKLAFGISPATKLVLIEFPKVLHASFNAPLRRLQQMTADDIAFGEYLAPRSHSHSLTSSLVHINIAPPSYCQNREFLYDLSPLTEDEHSLLRPQDFLDESVPATVKYVRENTTLDEGQALALCNSLGREFAFTQGPPGTGKTFLGVALARVLLASRSKAIKKPIIIVCLTNHALDAFLRGLRDAGVVKLLRIGAGSKEQWTKPINLREKTRKCRLSRHESGDLRGLRVQRKHTFAELTSWCESVSHQIRSGRPNWHQMEPVLKVNYPDIHSQLITATRSPETQSFAFDYWAAGGDLKHIGDLHKELSDRLIKNASSRTDEEHKIAESMLKEIATHIALSGKCREQNAIWHLQPPQRKDLLAE